MLARVLQRVVHQTTAPMPTTSPLPWRIEDGRNSRFSSIVGFAVLDPFGLRVGTVCGVVLRDPDDLRFLCIQTAGSSGSRGNRILPLAYVTLVDESRRYVQLSHLDRGAFEDICPIIDRSVNAAPFFSQYARIFAKPSEAVLATLGLLGTRDTPDADSPGLNHPDH